MHWWKIIMEKPAGRRCSVALRWKTYMYCRLSVKFYSVGEFFQKQ